MASAQACTRARPSFPIRFTAERIGKLGRARVGPRTVEWRWRYVHNNGRETCVPAALAISHQVR